MYNRNGQGCRASEFGLPDDRRRGAWLLGMIVPALPTHTPWLYVVLAEILAALIGLLAGILPAHLDPIEALRAE